MIGARVEIPEQPTGVGIHSAENLPDVIKCEQSPAGYLRLYTTTVIFSLVGAVIGSVAVPQNCQGSTYKIVTRIVGPRFVAPFMRPIGRSGQSAHLAHEQRFVLPGDFGRSEFRFGNSRLGPAPGRLPCPVNQSRPPYGRSVS